MCHLHNGNLCYQVLLPERRKEHFSYITYMSFMYAIQYKVFSVFLLWNMLIYDKDFSLQQ